MFKRTVFFTLFIFIFYCKGDEAKKPVSPLPEVRGELSKFKLDQSSVEALKRLDDYLALVNNSDREAKDFADGVKLSLIAAAASKNDGAFLSQITKTDGNPEQVRKYLADQKPVDDGLKFAYSAAANLVFSIQQPYDAGIKVPLKEIESRFGAKPGIFSTIRVMAMDYLAKTYTDAAGMDLDKRDVFLKNSLDRFVEVENYQPAHNDFHLYHGFSLLSKLMKLPEVQGDPLSGYLGELKKASVEKLSNLYFTLKIPYLNIPDSVEDTKFRLNSRMGKATYSGEFTPLEVVYSGSDALFTGLRPVVSFKDGAVVFHYKEKGVLFPGVETFRAEKLKEIKDKEIPALKENIVAVSGLAAEIEKKVFPAAAEKGFANSDRADKKAIALAVDTMSPVDLLEAAMKSLQKLGYADFRLLRASEPSSFFPVLYKDTTGLPQDIKDGLKRKGIIILIREKSADIYPPEGKPAKTKDLPPMPEKAKPLAVKNLLYKVTVPYDAEKGFSDALEPALKRIEAEFGPSPVVYLKSEAGLKSEALMEAAGIVSSLDGEPLKDIAKLAAGMSCDPAKGACVTHVPVLFSNAQIPPAPKEEVEMKANLPPGFCDKDAVKKVILGRSGAYRACYEIELQRRPELTGKIELRWVIDFDGSVVEIVVLSDGLNNKGVMDCLTKNIKQLKFLKPEGGVCVIRWPFVFTPK